MRRSDALAVLELDTRATPAEVKAAYRDLVRVWHPDRFGSDERLRQRAEERMQRINEAYRALESGELDPESAEYPANGQAQMTAEPQGEQKRALRGWGYLAAAAALGAFAGHSLVEHARAARESHETTAATTVASAVTESPATTAAGETRTDSRAITAWPNQRSPLRVTHLSEAQMEQLESACGGFAPESEQHGDCVRKQVAEMTARRGLEDPDLNGLTADERTSLRRVCARTTDYSRCAAEQIAGLASVSPRPDVSRLSAEDRDAVERACSSTRDYDGPAAYDRCAAATEELLTRR